MSPKVKLYLQTAWYALCFVGVACCMWTALFNSHHSNVERAAYLGLAYGMLNMASNSLTDDKLKQLTKRVEDGEKNT